MEVLPPKGTPVKERAVDAPVETQLAHLSTILPSGIVALPDHPRVPLL